MSSRLLFRIFCAVLTVWNSRFGLARRKRPETVRRILIAQNAALGDTLLLAPVLKKLRLKYPDAAIVVTCKLGFENLFGGRPFGVQAIGFDPRRVGTLRRLFRVRGFDLALLPADNQYSWLARAVDARWVVAFDGDRPPYKNWPVDELRPFPDRPTTFGDLIAEHLVDAPAPPPYMVSDWPPPPARPFDRPETPYCVVHLGANSPLRRWEPAKWRQVIDHLVARDVRPVLSAGPGEEYLVDEVDPERRLTAFAGTLSLPQIWHLLAGATAVICPDTGIAHMARLAGAPVAILFGPGSARLFGRGSFWKNFPDREITIAGFPCRDENLFFHRDVPWAEHCARPPSRCPQPKCMQALTVSMVTAALDSLCPQYSGDQRQIN